MLRVEDEMLYGCINMTASAFIKFLPSVGMTKEFLKKAYELGVGMVMPKNFVGVD